MWEDVCKSLTIIMDYLDMGPHLGTRIPSIKRSGCIIHSHKRPVGWPSSWLNGSHRSSGSRDGKNCIYTIMPSALELFWIGIIWQHLPMLQLLQCSETTLKNIKNFYWFKKDGGTHIGNEFPKLDLEKKCFFQEILLKKYRIYFKAIPKGKNVTAAKYYSPGKKLRRASKMGLRLGVHFMNCCLLTSGINE